MTLRLIREPLGAESVKELAEALGDRVRVAVDVARGVVAAGAEFHADCEELLLDDGSESDDVWGLDYLPASREIAFESLINIKPQVGNRTVDVQDPTVRGRAEGIVRRMLGEASW
jgi:hypothetical protein